MDEALRQQYLKAMGITVWERRDLPSSAEPVVEERPAEAGKNSPHDPLPPQVDASRDGGGTPAGMEVVERRLEPKPRATPGAKAEARSLPASCLPRHLSIPGRQDMGGGYPPEMDVPPPYEEIPPDWEPISLSGEAEILVSSLDWDGLRGQVKACRACGLRAGCTQTVFGVGNTQADLLVIGEAPGADEDRQGEPFVGRAGQLLNAMLLATGFKREQVFIANILKCRPPNNRDPRPEEALRCEPFLLRQIELIQPKVILSAGRISAQNLLKTDIAVGKLRGRVHRFGERQIPLVVTYHPAYLLRSPEQKGKSWDDLQLVLSLLRGTL